MADFTYTDLDNGGVIISGSVQIHVHPSMVCLSSSQLPELLTKLNDVVLGKENIRVVFNTVDGVTDLVIKNDVFTMRWGCAYDMVCSSSLSCSYPKNKQEITKFLSSLYSQYSVINAKSTN